MKEFNGEDGQLKEAVLANGTVLPADVCIMGVGKIQPCVQYTLHDFRNHNFMFYIH